MRLMIYPNDPNGDVLRRMEAEGDNLTKPRDIDFTVVFPVKNRLSGCRALSRLGS